MVDMTTSDPVKRVRNDAFEKAAPELAQHAEAIRALGRRALSDVVEIGERLAKAKQLIGHGHWLAWLKAEFGWTDETARRFMDVFELGKSRNLWNLDLPISALYLLAKRSTSEETRNAIFARCEAGERVSLAAVRERIAEDKPEARIVRVPVEYTTHNIVVPPGAVVTEEIEPEVRMVRVMVTEETEHPPGEARITRLEPPKINVVQLSVPLGDVYEAGVLVAAIERFGDAVREPERRRQALSRAMREPGRFRSVIRRIAEDILASLDAADGQRH